MAEDLEVQEADPVAGGADGGGDALESERPALQMDLLGHESRARIGTRIAGSDSARAHCPYGHRQLGGLGSHDGGEGDGPRGTLVRH